MENKRFLTELSFDELEAVFDGNEKLSYMVENDYTESVMSTVEDYLSCFRGALSNWSIGFYQRNFIAIKDNEKFIEGFYDFVKTFGIDEDSEKVFNGVYEWFNNEENKELENYFDLLDEKTSVLEKMLLVFFDGVTEIENVYILDHFTMMVELNHFDEYYILDNDFSVVYRDVEYTEELR